MSEMRKSVKKHNGELDIFRIIFALIVVFLHVGNSFGIRFFPGGSIAVEFFFLLAGFFMAKNAETRVIHSDAELAQTTWQYMMKKIAGVYPYYLCVLLIKLIVQVIIQNENTVISSVVSCYKAITTGTFTFMAVEGPSAYLYVNNTWYLSVMFLAMFLLYPLLLKSYDIHAKISFPLVSLFILGYLEKTNGNIRQWMEWQGICYWGILRAISEIAFGVCMYELSKVIKRKLENVSPNTFVRLLLTLVKAGCFALPLLFALGFGKTSDDIYILMWMGLGIALSFAEVGYTVRGSKVTDWLGKVSLPIFIFHGVLNKILSAYLANGENLSLKYVLTVTTCIGVSVILMFCVDFVQKRLQTSMKKPLVEKK